jgi:DNA-directed RNA polymerase specialized sigma24 family protein
VNEDQDQPDELYHPPFVREALEWAENLSPSDLLTAARINDKGGSGFIPPPAVVRLIRRARVEGNAELSTRLTAILIERLLPYVKAMFNQLHQEKNDVVQETMKRFLGDLAEMDGIDWWEITFTRKLKGAAVDAYRSMVKRPRSRTAPWLAEYEKSDDGKAARALERKATLRAFADAHFRRQRDRELFVLLIEGEIPIEAADAPTDLVRLSGLGVSTLRNKKTQYERMLKAALAETRK